MSTVKEKDTVREPRNNPNVHYATPIGGEETVGKDTDSHTIDSKLHEVLYRTTFR